MRCLGSSAFNICRPCGCLDIIHDVVWTCRAEVRNKIWTAAIVVIVATAALWLYKEGYTASLKVRYRNAADICLHVAGMYKHNILTSLCVVQEYVAKSQLGKSGFPAAFSLIFVSEIGDKTFFIAALLAAKFGRWLSFSASLLSLSVMSVISVGIGQSFRHVPEFLKSGLPIGEWASVALLVYFGIRTIKVCWQHSSSWTVVKHRNLQASHLLIAISRRRFAGAGCLGYAGGHRGWRGAGGCTGFD